jgi:hypothetical protein
LNVLWPKVRLEVPTRLETFETNVSVRIAFTTNVCAPMSKRRDHFGILRFANTDGFNYLAGKPRVEVFLLFYRDEGCHSPY